MNYFRSLRENFWSIEAKETFCILIVHKLCLCSSWWKLCWNRTTVRAITKWINCFWGSINKWPTRTAVASWYHSFISGPSPNYWLNVFICETSLDDLSKIMCVFCNSTSLPNLLRRNKICLIYIVFRPLCLPAVAVFSHESSKINRYLVPLLGRFSIESEITSGNIWGFCAFAYKEVDIVDKNDQLGK